MSTIHDSDYMDMSIGMAYRFLDKNTVLTEAHDHNYYEYFIVTSGNITHEVNNEKQNLKSGSMVLIRPSDYHKYSVSEGSEFKLINISFCKLHFEAVQAYFKSPVIDMMLADEMPPLIYLSSTQLSSLKKKHYLLNVGSDKNGLITQLRTLLIDIFSYFIMEYERQSLNDSKRWLKNVLNQMNTPENIEEGLPALLRYSGFSHGHLCRIMKEELGITPTKFITDLRLTYAANLLTTTDYDILSIAMRLGFSSLSYFITIFKEKYNITPSKYRAQHNNIHIWK